MERRLTRTVTVLLLSVAAVSQAAVVPAEAGWLARTSAAQNPEDALAGTDAWKPLAPLAEPAGHDDVWWLRVPVPAGTWRQPTLQFASFSGTFDGWSVASDGALSPLGSGGTGLGTLASGYTLVPLTPATHELLLRIDGPANGAGGPVGHVVVGDPAELVAERLKVDAVLLLSAALLFAVGFACLVAWLFLREVTVLAALGAWGLVNAVLWASIAQTTMTLMGDPVRAQRLSLPAAGLFVATLCVSIASLGGSFAAAWFRRLAWGQVALGVVFALVTFGDIAAGARLLPAMVLVMTVGLVAAGVVTVRAARAGDGDGRVLALGALLFLVANTVDALPFVLTNRLPETYTSPLGVVAMTIAFGVVAGRRLTGVMQRLGAQAEALARGEAAARATNTRLGAASRRLVDVVETLGRSSESQSRGLSEQAAALQETQVTAEEIKRTSAMAAEKAKLLLGATGEAEEVGRDAETAIQDALAGIEAIGGEVAEVARQVASVEKRAAEIGGIVGTVKELADQSNMLALNAAIVAVRAGEHGRAFSVVAREVRRMADQSVLATDRIGKVLAGVSSAVGEASGTSRRGAERVAASIEQLKTSTQRLQRLGAISREANAGVRQISAAVTQQNAGVTQIFQAIEDLSKHMNETMERLRDVESSASAVRAVATEMAADASTGVTGGSAA